MPGVTKSPVEGEIIVFKRIVAAVFVTVMAVVGAAAPASAHTGAAAVLIDWE